MGWLVLQARFMPRVLGWMLLVGGAGYMLSAYVGFLFAGSDGATSALIIPATIGEFWMIGYLLTRGVRSAALPALSG